MKELQCDNKGSERQCEERRGKTRMEGAPGGHSYARGDMREPEGEPRRREKPDGEKTRRGGGR